MESLWAALSHSERSRAPAPPAPPAPPPFVEPEPAPEAPPAAVATTSESEPPFILHTLDRRRDTLPSLALR
jgi:hypothetical protein